MNGMRNAAKRGTAIFGECGGYMVLGNGVVDRDGTRYPMLGLLELETSFEMPKLLLGYREVSLLEAGVLGCVNQKFRGHEFHYASILKKGNHSPLFHVKDAVGRELGSEGLINKNVSGTFCHLIDLFD